MQNNFLLPISTIEKDLEDSDVMDFFLTFDLEPKGFKSPESFWKMVDEAKKMSKPFGDFITIHFKTEVQGFTNRVSGYRSPFETWDEVFKSYRKYLDR